ncbi:hypothetical protein HKCCE3408_18995 [Rhodobacterales bacterium HKCCE3408]|nr:hypothetical protein [Rhodobacterales bacterium HKCCE3408]
MGRIPPVTPQDLFRRLFAGGIDVLDVRIPEDVAADPGWLPGAARVDYREAKPDRAAAPVVAACDGGRKISQGVAAQADRGAYLAGGVRAWRDAGLPLWTGTEGPCDWVGPADPDIDSRLSDWLLRRLMPIGSRVFRVEAGEVDAAADRFGWRVLPPPEGVLAMLDRPVPALDAVLAAARTPAVTHVVESLAHLPTDRAVAPGAILDALVLAALDRGAAR